MSQNIKRKKEKKRLVKATDSYTATDIRLVDELHK